MYAGTLVTLLLTASGFSVDVYHVALVGQKVDLSCPASNQQSVMWDYISMSANPSVTIYNGIEVRSNFLPRFDIGFFISEKRSHLYISTITQRDAGSYRCLDLGNGRPRFAVEVTVIASEPSCSSNMTSSGQELLDVVVIRCRVSYSGHQHPDLRCLLEPLNTSLELYHNRTLGNSTFLDMEFEFKVIAGRETHNNNITCTTYFSTNDGIQFSSTWHSPTLTIRDMKAADPQSSSPTDILAVGNHSHTDQHNDTPASSTLVAVICVGAALTLLLVLLVVWRTKCYNSSQSHAVDPGGYTEIAELPAPNNGQDVVTEQGLPYDNLDPSDLPPRLPKVYAGLNIDETALQTM